jgi:hypothetical protein
MITILAPSGNRTKALMQDRQKGSHGKNEEGRQQYNIACNNDYVQ